MEENESILIDFNKRICDRGFIDTSFLQGILSERALHISLSGIEAHWRTG